MLTSEEFEERDQLRERIEFALNVDQIRRLIALERKDVDPTAGPVFERGLPSMEDRLAHSGPWESWESPMDRCIIWFSPDGSGYDVDYGHGEPRTYHPVTVANWSSTWMRKIPRQARRRGREIGDGDDKAR